MWAHDKCKPIISMGIVCALLLGHITAIADQQYHDERIYSLGFGMLAHDVDLDWANDREEDGVDYNLEVVFNQIPLEFWQGKFHPNMGISVNDRGNTSKVYAGMLWRRALTDRVTFSSGLSLVLHDGETNQKVEGSKRLGSRMLFRIPLELGYDFNNSNSVAIVLEHTSNASIDFPNEGMDSLGVRYQYRF